MRNDIEFSISIQKSFLFVIFKKFYFNDYFFFHWAMLSRFFFLFYWILFWWKQTKSISTNTLLNLPIVKRGKIIIYQFSFSLILFFKMKVYSQEITNRRRRSSKVKWKRKIEDIFVLNKKKIIIIDAALY